MSTQNTNTLNPDTDRLKREIHRKEVDKGEEQRRNYIRNKEVIHNPEITARITRPRTLKENNEEFEAWKRWFRSKPVRGEITDYKWSDKNPQKPIDNEKRFYDIVVSECRKCNNMKKQWEEITDFEKPFDSYIPSIASGIRRKSKKSNKSKKTKKYKKSKKSKKSRKH